MNNVKNGQEAESKLSIYSDIKIFNLIFIIKRHILANYDEKSIIVYQAFNSKIADAAVTSQNFNTKICIDNGYEFTRMSWIKTNFLWMMYRAGWATKANQEKILAIRITRTGFEDILSKCKLSSVLETENDSDSSGNAKKSNRNDPVRLQWDPDHLPDGSKVSSGRRAIQLGLRNDMLKKFCDEYILNIYDITDFVTEQRISCIDTADFEELLMPIENVYRIENPEIAQKICVDQI